MTLLHLLPRLKTHLRCIIQGVIYSLVFLSHEVLHAEIKALAFEEVISTALEKNFDILSAKSSRKTSLLSKNLSTLHIWLPKATLMAAQENKWEKDAKSFYFRSSPFFTLTWELKSVVDKIFQTKMNVQHTMLNNLVATKNISNALQKVVTGYYELALAQKRYELSNTFIKIAQSRLKIEEEKCSLGFVSKINCLNADLALKEANLALLKEQETLKEKSRNLNLMLGRPLNEAILVASTIPVAPIWDMDTAKKVVNLEAAIQEKKVAIAKTELTRAKSYLLSCLSLSSGFFSSGYTYNWQNKRWNSRPSSTSVKIEVSVDLGGLLLMPTEIKKAKIGLNNEKFKLHKETLSAEDQLESQKWIYHHALEVHKIAAERLNISKQKLAFVQAAYRVHQVKLLELQEAEENVQKSEIDLIVYAFKVKQAEFALYRLVGMFDK